MDEGLALWLLIGLIGCGKTTFSRRIWEKNPVGTLRICLDEIIQMMSFYAYDQKLTAFYGEAERIPIVRGLVNRKSVIVDRTNLVKNTREYMINMGKRVRETAHDLLQFLGRSESDLLGRKSESEIALLLLQHVHDRLDRSPTPHEQIINEAFLGLFERRSFFDRELDLFPERITRENVKSHLERVADLKIHAVLFDVPAEICLDRRLNDPKNVFRNQVRDVDWSDVMKKMKNQMEPPEQSEGFDRIFVVDENGDVKEEF